MKRLKQIVLLCLFGYGSIYAQWSPGTDIYNTNTGNVGIGKTSPTSKLDVEGNIRSSSASTTGVPSFFHAQNAENASLQLKFTEDAIGSVPKNLWQYRIGGSGRDIAFTYYDLNAALLLDVDNQYVGIGTFTPAYALDVEGQDAAFFSLTGENTLRMGRNVYENFEFNVGDNYAYFDYYQDSDNNTDHIFFIRNMALGSSPNNDIRFQTSSTDRMTIKTNGNIGIGTTEPGEYKLAVEGQIGARSIKVTEAAWADYVFAPSYQLMPLSEVEAYITQNQHLPNVPSAKEIEEKGFVLEEMDAKLMEKIEELTLYVIEQQKEINALKEELKRNNENHENKK